MNPVPGRPTTPSSRRELDRRFASGVAWTAAARWSTQVLTWASVLLLTRLLTPRDFGLLGMAGLLSSVIALMSEFGIDGAVLVSKDLTASKIRHLHSLAIGLGFCGFLAACAGAPLVAGLFRTPELTRIVFALAVSLVISGFRVVPQSLLLRELRFKAVAAVETGQAVAQAATALTLAYLGFAYWSLVLGILAANLFSTLTFSLMRTCRPGKPVWSGLRQEITISWQLLVGRLSWFAYSNSDFAVAGRMLGTSALGRYTVAWNIAGLPVEKVTTLITRVTPSVFLQVRHEPAEIRRYIRGVTETMALVTFPIAFGLAVVSRLLVETLFDHRWWDAAVPMCLLAACASIRCLETILPQVLTVLGDTETPMWVSLATAVVLPVSFWYASRWGIVGIAAAWLCVYPFACLPLVYLVLRKTEMRAREYLGALAPASLACAVMVAAVLLEGSLLPTTLPAGLRLAIEIATGAACYSAIILLFFRSRAEALIRIIRKGEAPPGGPDS